MPPSTAVLGLDDCQTKINDPALPPDDREIVPGSARIGGNGRELQGIARIGGRERERDGRGRTDSPGLASISKLVAIRVLKLSFISIALHRLVPSLTLSLRSHWPTLHSRRGKAY
jgi:hypothetical protein